MADPASERSTPHPNVEWSTARRASPAEPAFQMAGSTSLMKFAAAMIPDASRQDRELIIGRWSSMPSAVSG